ncbi:hypothetical protein ACOSQ3_023785 [Xanthoceras sorbifolium]
MPQHEIGLLCLKGGGDGRLYSAGLEPRPDHKASPHLSSLIRHPYAALRVAPLLFHLSSSSTPVPPLRSSSAVVRLAQPLVALSRLALSLL